MEKILLDQKQGARKCIENNRIFFKVKQENKQDEIQIYLKNVLIKSNEILNLTNFQIEKLALRCLIINK